VTASTDRAAIVILVMADGSVNTDMAYGSWLMAKHLGRSHHLDGCSVCRFCHDFGHFSCASTTYRRRHS
jgi:hypothetical protein